MLPFYSRYILNSSRIYCINLNSCMNSQSSIRGIRSIRRPIRINLGSQESKQKYVEDYLEENKFTIQPVKKVVDDMAEKFHDDSFESENIFQKKHIKKIDKEKKQDIKNMVKTENIKEINKILPDLKFKHTKEKDLNILGNCKLKNYRNENKIFLLEGKKLIFDALYAGIVPRKIFFSRKEDLIGMLPKNYAGFSNEISALNELPLYKASYNHLKFWSSLDTSPGLFGIFEMPSRLKSPEDADQLLPITVILEEIRDPQNLGSIIRTLSGVGVQNVLVMNGCCDLWQLECIRASSGGLFFLNLHDKVKWTHLLKYTEGVEDVYLADIGCNEIKSNSILSKIRPYVSRNDPGIDADLDLAYEALNESSEGEYIEFQKDGSELTINITYEDIDHLKKYSNVLQKSQLYDSVDYFSSESTKHKVLVITGENGITLKAKKYCFENQAIELKLPFNNHIQSLGSSVAASILLYEFKRSFNEQKIKA